MEDKRKEGLVELARLALVQGYSHRAAVALIETEHGIGAESEAEAIVVEAERIIGLID